MSKTGLCCFRLSEPMTCLRSKPWFRVAEKLPANHVSLTPYSLYKSSRGCDPDSAFSGLGIFILSFLSLLLAWKSSEGHNCAAPFLPPYPSCANCCSGDIQPAFVERVDEKVSKATLLSRSRLTLLWCNLITSPLLLIILRCDRNEGIKKLYSDKSPALFLSAKVLICYVLAEEWILRCVSWPNDKGSVILEGFFWWCWIARSHSPRFCFPPVVKAGIRIKPLILVITHRLARQKTSDNHTVAFWVHFTVKYKEFDQNTWKHGVSFVEGISKIAKMTHKNRFDFRAGRELRDAIRWLQLVFLPSRFFVRRNVFIWPSEKFKLLKIIIH